MTEIATKRLRELLASATPGEWRFSPWHIEEGNPAIRVAGYGILGTFATDEQAEFVAKMHEALLTLLAVYEAVEEAPEFVVMESGWNDDEWEFDGRVYAIPSEMIGQRVRLVRSGRGGA